MASFGRTARQDVLWVLFNDIRDIIDEGLRAPEDAENYEGGDEVALQVLWDAYDVEYTAIHTANGTKG